MIILRQKEFISTKLKAAYKLTRLGRDTKFAGQYVGGTIGRTVKTLGDSILHPVRTVRGVGSGIVGDNKAAIGWAKDTIKTVANPNVSAGKKVSTALTTAMDFNPATASVLAVGDKVKHVAGKTGKDMVRSMAELRYNPIKKVGEEAAIIRTSQGYNRFGGHMKRIGGTWTKGGVNNACLGTAPDRVLYHVGDTWEKSQGGKVASEIESFVNSRQGKRMARAYDKRIAKTTNPIATGVDGALGKSEGIITRGWGKVKSIFSKEPRPVIA